MRVLLDESIPVDFAQDPTSLDVQTVIGLGWAGLKNGALLRQNLRPMVAEILAAVAAVEPGKIRVVGV